MSKAHGSEVSRYWPFAHYNKHGKVAPADVPYHGESYPARLYEYSHFPYTYAYDVPGVMTYPRSLYGRAISDYGYRSPYSYRSELFGYKYPPYLTAEEMEYYRDAYYPHPRFSRYRPYVDAADEDDDHYHHHEVALGDAAQDVDDDYDDNDDDVETYV